MLIDSAFELLPFDFAFLFHGNFFRFCFPQPFCVSLKSGWFDSEPAVSFRFPASGRRV
jgi:hypothetical protein